MGFRLKYREENALRRMAILDGVAGLAWIGVAWGYVPGLLAAAYRGASPFPVLDRWVQGRFHRGLGHYLRLWDDFAAAVVIAVVAHLGLIGLAAWRNAREADPGARRTRVDWVAVAGAWLAFAVLSGPRQDYVAYGEIWRSIRTGADPWAISPAFGYALNSYGPAFNLLAAPDWVNPLAPKLGFAAAYLAAVLVAPLPRTSAGRWRFLALAACPYFWVEVAYFGHFDVLVGLLCVAAVAARGRGLDGRAGVALGLGFLLKFVPVALVPILATDGRRLRPRLVVAAVAVAVMAGGLGLAAWVWGGASVLRPFAFASGRGSMFASIFRFLRGAYSPLRLLMERPNLDRFSLPCLAGAGLATWGIAWAGRLRADAAAVLAALVVTALYRVGFLQYPMVPALLLLGWLGGDDRRWSGDAFVRWAVVAYLGWLSALDLLVVWGGGVIHPDDPLGWLDDVVGLPGFALSAAVWAAVLRAELRLRGIEADP